MSTLRFQSAQGERIFRLEGERLQVGRGPESGVFLEDASVSQRHAILTRSGATYAIADAGSHFGTFINARPAVGQLLREGDTVRAGDVSLTFSFSSDPSAASPEVAGGVLENPLILRIRELEASLERMGETQLRTLALVALQSTLLRCSSPERVLTSSGQEVLRAARADRGVLLLAEGDAGAFSVKFSQRLDAIPEGRFSEVREVISRGVVRELGPGTDERAGLLAPLLGRDNTVLGLVYAELAPGKTPLAPDTEHFCTVCVQVSAALANLTWLEQVRREQVARASLSRDLSQQGAPGALAHSRELGPAGE